jgi:hypothetical protein
MPGKKYAPLSAFLIAEADRGRTALRLDFADIADMVGGLPASAYRHREWWANSYLVQATGWRSAGWRVTTVDLAGCRVQFTREHGAGP